MDKFSLCLVPLLAMAHFHPSRGTTGVGLTVMLDNLTPSTSIGKPSNQPLSKNDPNPKTTFFFTKINDRKNLILLETIQQFPSIPNI